MRVGLCALRSLEAILEFKFLIHVDGTGLKLAGEVGDWTELLGYLKPERD